MNQNKIFRIKPSSTIEGNCKLFFGFVLLLSLSFLPSVNYSQTTTFSGYMMGDYYYVAQNNNAEIEGQNGFWFRRIYFTQDNKLSDEFQVRLRLELGSPGDFTSSSKIEPFLKDGYLKWMKSGHSITFGLSSTPTFEYIESIWGYRSVEKTPADIYKLGSSRDFGLSFQGKLDQAKKISYNFMVSNGSGTKAETSKGKKVMFALGYQLTSSFSFEFYSDYDDRPGKANRNSFQGFLAYKTKNYRLGLQLLQQKRQQDRGEDQEIRMLSVFGATKLKEKLWTFARFDRSFDPVPEGPTISYLPVNGSSKFNFLVAGIDFRPIPQVQLMPNVEMVFYDKSNGVRPGTDIIPRFSFYYIWK